MTPLPVENLKKEDIVLVEAQVTRYNKKPNNGSTVIQAKNKAKAKEVGPSEWDITFELCSISLLDEAPVTLVSVDPSCPDFSASI